ncbi:MAG: pirin family protein [Crocinitomicaceae bacterium]|nr:pirin family protein [Crocinitomicaceae bacterium]
MKNRKVIHSLPAEKVDMGGFPVKQSLPTNNVSQVDPFLLLHHGKIKPIYDRPAHIQGVGPHPHRGFSPVTFIIEGEVHHRDSRGNNQIAREGEVQWMHAGAGVIHSERPSEALLERRGTQEIIQLWINTPAKHKMNEPEYLHIIESEIPRIQTEDGLTDLKLISGKYGELSGNIRAKSELLVVWGKSKENGHVALQIPEGYNAAIYSVKGNLRIEGHGIVDPESLIVFDNEGDQISLQADTESQYLILAGEPINEKMVQHGPFVMNSETEIMEAMRDYQMGKMGVLIEETP